MANKEKSMAKSCALSVMLVLFSISFLPDIGIASPAIKSVDGSLSPDLDGDPYMDLMIVVSNISDAELALKTDEDKSYLGRIEIRLLDSETGNSYIQTSPGDGLADNNHGFYWDKAQTEAGAVRDVGPNDHEITYVLKILENKDSPKAQKLTSLLKTAADTKSIKVKVNFFLKDDQGQLKSVAESTDILIEQNFALPNEAPGDFSAAGTHKSLTAKWSVKPKVSYSDKKERSVTGVVVLIAKNSGGAPIELDAAAKVTSGKETPPTDGACTLTPPETDGDACIVCDDEANTYIDLDKVAEVPGMELSRAVANSGETSISGVEDEQIYTIALQYKNGLKRTACYNVSSINNFVLLEFNGENEGKPEDLRCFIATAAFGSPLEHHVKLFRWFRDRLLTKHTIGKSFVNSYYRLSPKAAQFIAEHDSLRATTRALLTPIAWFLYICKWMSNHLALAFWGVLATMLMVFVGLWRDSQRSDV